MPFRETVNAAKSAVARSVARYLAAQATAGATCSRTRGSSGFGREVRAQLALQVFRHEGVDEDLRGIDLRATALRKCVSAGEALPAATSTPAA